jgi:hypothetical protein
MNPINFDEIPFLFPLPNQSSQIGVIANGIIIKFNTFYLKIYDYDKSEDYCYKVMGYLYQDDRLIFEDIVSCKQFKMYASQFIYDDFLISFMQRRKI